MQGYTINYMADKLSLQPFVQAAYRLQRDSRPVNAAALNVFQRAQEGNSVNSADLCAEKNLCSLD